jgi:exopolyphosphatase/guanosine-5'-triphosphate,3'-diphosphate pyrophosphatase
VIAHGSFHKHGAYIMANADLPGFSREQQALLAALVRVHRRKFSSTDFETLALSRPGLRSAARRSCCAVGDDASRPFGQPQAADADDGRRTADPSRIPTDWLAEHPLTEAELSREADYLSNAGFSLQYA